MNANDEVFALVLAGGGNASAPVPTQYRTGEGGTSTFAATLERAARIVPRDRILTLVCADHREHYGPAVEKARIPAENVLLQPSNRGTAPGILAPVLEILARAPEATVVFFPSDDAVDKEDILEATLAGAVRLAGRRPDSMFLLGISPDAPEPGYGWIVPEESEEPLSRVSSFFEKPDASMAIELFRRGGLWNSFIWAARAKTVIEEYRRALPELLAALEAPDLGPFGTVAFAKRYAGLPDHDFSRDILESSERLWVYRVPQCGWRELGPAATQGSPTRAT